MYYTMGVCKKSYAMQAKHSRSERSARVNTLAGNRLPRTVINWDNGDLMFLKTGKRTDYLGRTQPIDYYERSHGMYGDYRQHYDTLFTR